MTLRSEETFTVIVSFGVVSPSYSGELPPEVNMEFESEQGIEAMEYFVACLNYFRAAHKFDPKYYGLGILMTFWQGNYAMVQERIAI